MPPKDVQGRTFKTRNKGEGYLRDIRGAERPKHYGCRRYACVPRDSVLPAAKPLSIERNYTFVQLTAASHALPSEPGV